MDLAMEVSATVLVTEALATVLVMEVSVMVLVTEALATVLVMEVSVMVLALEALVTVLATEASEKALATDFGKKMKKQSKNTSGRLIQVDPILLEIVIYLLVFIFRFTSLTIRKNEKNRFYPVLSF
jgi:hypothetical protein